MAVVRDSMRRGGVNRIADEARGAPFSGRSDAGFAIRRTGFFDGEANCGALDRHHSVLEKPALIVRLIVAQVAA